MVHGLLHDVLGVAPDFVRVVLDPAWLGIDLFVLFLGDADDPAAAIEDNEARAGGALVDRADVAWHLERPPIRPAPAPAARGKPGL